MTVAQSKAGYEQARLERETAEVAVKEYVEGLYPQSLQTVQGEIALAGSNRKQAQERLDRSKQLQAKGMAADAQVAAQQRALQKANLTEEQAKTKKKLLETFTRSKTVKKLQSEVEKARASELALKAKLEAARSYRERLKTMIGQTGLLAPADGEIAYDPAIEEGATLREGQVIFRVVPDPTPKAGPK